MNLLHIVVSYNNPPEIKQYIQDASLHFKGAPLIHDFTVNCWIIDNTESSELAHKTQEQVVSPFKYMKTPKNLGYWGAVSWAAQMPEARNADWIVVSNSDLRMDTANFYSRLSSQIKSNSQKALPQKISILGPIIYSTKTQDNTNPLSLKPPSKIKIKTWKFFLKSYILWCIYMILGFVKSKIGSSTVSTVTFSEETRVYANHGAFFAMNSDFFRQLSSLPFPGFLYLEEYYLAEASLALGWIQVFDPHLKVTHIEHGSTGKWRYLFSKQLYQFRKNSFFGIYSKFWKEL